MQQEEELGFESTFVWQQTLYLYFVPLSPESHKTTNKNMNLCMPAPAQSSEPSIKSEGPVRWSTHTQA